MDRVVVRAEDLPTPTPKSLDDVIAWSGFVAAAVATGRMDARSAGEVTRALAVLKTGLEKRELEQQVRELKRQLARYEKASA